MRAVIISTFITSAALAFSVPANAADNEFQPGFYAGFGLGVSDLDVKSQPLRTTHQNDKGVLKLYGGYQFLENFGIEGGYIRSGHVNVTDVEDGMDITRKAKTRSAYLAGVASMPVTQRISLTGRVGMAFGDVNENADVAPIPNTVYGSKQSLMLGVGVQYAFSKWTSISFDFDHLGKESSQVSADVLTLSIRRKF